MSNVEIPLETVHELFSLDLEEQVIQELEPLVEEPVVQESVLEEQVVHEETIEEEHAVQEPVPEELVVQEPEPFIEEEQVVQEPEPIEDESVVQEPLQEEPLVEEHVVQEPLQEEPLVEEHVVQEPLPEEPLVEEPKIPSLVFIVPYRDRESHHKIFSNQMQSKLHNSPVSYKIFYLNQADDRSFNRGAMKNIGFLAVKQMYPNDYQNMTFVFNDIDTMPSNEIDFDYVTTPGIIKHFYGFDYTLGGIVSIHAIDFERLNGFPNFWAWGFEDNLLQIRANNAGIEIDRSVFYKIGDPKIIHLIDTSIREVNSSEFRRYMLKTNEGIRSIHDISFEIDSDTGFVHVSAFETGANEIMETRTNYDLRNGPAPFKIKPKRNPTMKMKF